MESDPANKEDYKRLVGSLIFYTNTRPDLVYAISVLSRFMTNPLQTHIEAAKQVLRYIRGTISRGLFFPATTKLTLTGYIDLDWRMDLDGRRSTTGFLFTLGSAPIS